ncbi:MAG: anaerobic ribonucleoside-triphosphate reductase activating protein [Clostridia bacterium]|nr:anaerobic ribonucleoside-triphosphate reductase activating protein [Clostridia bacterium]MBR5903084.1 anaerobic ribonucleoside-triphosphate reductase activating protein [Clostridia bacterium]
MSELRIAGVVPESIVDGPGFRFAVFTQGCPHHCEGCHNPNTHDFSGGEVVDTDTLWERIKKDILLSGVTFSGGEPFEQAGNLLDLARKIKGAKLELAAYSGYTFDELVAAGGDKLELLKLCDVLVDGRFVLAQRSLMLRFRGSKNQRLIDVQRSLSEGCVQEIHDGRWQD